MTTELFIKIIKNIHNNKEYSVNVNNKSVTLKGVDFKGHIISTYKKINDDDGNKILQSLTNTKEAAEDKSIKNDSKKNALQ